MKKFKKIIIIVAILALILSGAFLLYVNDYYHRTNDVSELLETSADMIVKSDSYLTFLPNPELNQYTAILFYPGGKVDHKAYSPLMFALAQKGYTTILFEMPFNLAVFDINAANKVVGNLDNIDNYFMMGHSLGGAMASKFTSENADLINGLILLGAYPIGDTQVPTLTLYGENDLVINRDRLVNVQNRMQIKGGNHAYFGNYGQQANDGIATITNTQQQEISIELITEFIDKIIN